MKSYQEFLNEESISKVSKRIASLTNDNDHTGSVIELANWLKDSKALKQLGDIKSKHEEAGSLSLDLSNKRNKITKSLLAVAKSKLNDAEYKKLHGSF